MRVAVFNDTQTDTGHYGCELVMRQLFTRLSETGSEVVFSFPYNRDWRENRELLPSKGKIDLLLVNGEGSLHGAPQRKRPVSLIELGALARDFYEIPSVLVNATLFNNHNEFYSSMQMFDEVWTRDEASASTARAKGIQARYCPDLTFSKKLGSGVVPRKDVGVTDSVDRQTDWDLRSFSNKLGLEFSAMDEDPSRLKIADLWHFGRVKRFVSALKRDLTFGASLRSNSVDSFLDWVQSKECVVTGRYHTVTICILTSTPFVYLESNTPKIDWLCADVGLGHLEKLP